MGAHSSAESLMAGVESDSLRYQAAALAVIFNGWLTAQAAELTPLDGMLSDEVEVLRQARDVLEAVGRG